MLLMIDRNDLHEPSVFLLFSALRQITGVGISPGACPTRCSGSRLLKATDRGSLAGKCGKIKSVNGENPKSPCLWLAHDIHHICHQTFRPNSVLKSSLQSFAMCESKDLTFQKAFIAMIPRPLKLRSRRFLGWQNQHICP